jgi:hypothetical protein
MTEYPDEDRLMAQGGLSPEARERIRGQVMTRATVHSQLAAILAEQGVGDGWQGRRELPPVCTHQTVGWYFDVSDTGIASGLFCPACGQTWTRR